MGGARAHTLASSHPVGHGLGRESRLSIVMGQNFRLRFSCIGELLAKNIRNASMEFAPAGLEQRLVRCVLDQRVLERIVRLGRNPANVNQFGVGPP